MWHTRCTLSWGDPNMVSCKNMLSGWHRHHLEVEITKHYNHITYVLSVNKFEVNLYLVK